MSTAAPATMLPGSNTSDRMPPRKAPSPWPRVLTMLTPAAASETSFGVSARTGIKLDCVGRYAAETAASNAMSTSATKIG